MRTVFYLLSVFLIALSAPTHAKVLVAGDSTVANGQKGKHGWGDFIGAHLKDDVAVINLAKGGRSSKSFITEGRWDNLMSQVSPGDTVFVQFGHNDSHKGEEKSTDSETDYKDYLRKYADDVAAASAKLIFVTPPHRWKFRPDGSISQELLPYRNAMISVATEKKVPFVDLHTLTGDEMEKLGDKGVAPIFCGTDHTHFSETGAAWLAELIMNTVRAESMMSAELFADQ